MSTEPTVFSQLIDFTNEQIYGNVLNVIKGNYGVKSFSCCKNSNMDCRFYLSSCGNRKGKA